jgi:hypothetical protein
VSCRRFPLGNRQPIWRRGADAVPPSARLGYVDRPSGDTSRLDQVACRRPRGQSKCVRRSTAETTFPTLLERLAARGESLRYQVARLLALLDDYGPQELAAAIDRALDRDALGAGAIAHILETRRRQRGLKPPIPIALPDRPGVRDLDVTPHRLETYDDLTRSDPDDAE